MATTGSSSSPFWRVVSRRSYTLLGVICALLLIVLISIAAADIFAFARQSDQRTHEAVVRGELARFILATRDEAGGNLLENPEQFSRAERSLSIVSLKRSFFTYFLKRANAATFDENEVTWQAPSQCIVEFKGTPGNENMGTLQACFAKVENDPLGSYVYFSLRFPSRDWLIRHERGRALGRADIVKLTLLADKPVSAILAFETPPLALQRYPSRLNRFTKVHEVTGYQQDGQVLRWIGGQAIEREEVVTGKARKYIQVLGRIDSLALVGMNEEGGPDLQKLSQLKVGVATFEHDSAEPIFNVPVGGSGTALQSLEQAYLQQVQSKSRLEVLSTRPPHKYIWSSESISTLRGSEHRDWFQVFSDRWTDSAIRILSSNAKPFKAEQQVSGLPGIEVSLTKMPPQIPEMGARLLTMFVAAILVVLAFFFVYFKAILRLGALANAAYELAAHPTKGRLTGFKMNNTELGTFARVLEISIRKSRIRGLRSVYLAEFGVRVKRAQLQARHAVLEALGHEIREPLQSLILKAEKEGRISPQLLRMQHAISTLYNATDLLSAVDKGKAVLSREDLCLVLKDFCAGHGDDEIELNVPTSEVIAMVDTFWLEPALENIVNNAMRHKKRDSRIKITLIKKVRSVQIEIYNEGNFINSDRLEAIFEYGTSSKDNSEQRGIGLFMARLYMLAMYGSIKAINRENGVVMILELPAPMDVAN